MKNAFFIFLVLISLSTVAQTNCNVGNQTYSGYSNAADPITKNYLLGIKFTVADTGILTSLNLIGRNTNALVKMALYKDSLGFAQNLVVSTRQDTVRAGVLSIPVTPFILPAGNYWIMAIYNIDGKHTYSKAVAGNKIYYKSMDYSTTIPLSASKFDSISNITFTYFLGIKCGTTLAVTEPINSSIINFYPNPASDLITINTQPNLVGESYRIITIAGTQVATGQLTSETNAIDINALQAGLYFMIIGDKQHEAIKFIKQ